MIKKITKHLMAFAVISIIALPMFVFTLNAQAATAVTNNKVDVWGGGATGVTSDTIQGQIGLGATDPREMAASIINVAMGFLGIIAVILILIGGFKFMTASGSEDKVEEAVKLIKYGIIGLVIVLASFALAKFVVNALLGATGATT